jgi:FdrA protein
MKKVIVKKSTYRDSISLMKISNRLQTLPGVTQAAVVMSTELNRRVLAEAGFRDDIPKGTASDDMIIAIEADSESSLTSALEGAEKLLASSGEESEGGAPLPTSLGEALRSLPDANLVLISVPGTFAKREALGALAKGLNVFLFSSNVSREDELELKRISNSKGLLLMGPDCGTSIINQKVLGFGNSIRAGSIGLVSASGTGLQEVSTLVHKAGLGVSQAIGTGGGDLSDEIGGITMIQGISLLDADAKTKIIIMISKPPGAATLQKVLEVAKQSHKPVVANFLGADTATGVSGGVRMASTLDEAARLACEASGVAPTEGIAGGLSNEVVALARSERGRLAKGQRFVRGLFSGGTLCYESQVILRPLVGIVYSNAPVESKSKVDGEAKSKGHACIDMGAEEFVEGRAHPMMDFSLRNLRIVREAKDASTAVILLDVELGYGSNADPAGQLIPAINKARDLARKEARYLAFVASIVGTDGDSQGLERQQKALSDAGVMILPSNAQATRAAALIATGTEAPVPAANPMKPVAAKAPAKSPSANVGSILIGKPLKVVNIGISTFADDLRTQGVEVVHVDWKPPAGGDVDMLKILERLGS